MARPGVFAIIVLAAMPLAFGQTAETPADPLETARSDANQGKLAEAETEVRKFLKSQGDSAKGHFLLGYLLFRQQKARESLAEMTEGAKYQRPSAGDLRGWRHYVLLSDYGDADKWFPDQPNGNRRTCWAGII